MRHLFCKFFLAAVLLCTTADAQVQPPDTTLFHWIPAGVVGINLSQIALDNWTQGGDDAITWVFNGNFGLSYNTVKWKFANQLKFAYGRSKIGSSSYRTNDNEIYLENVFSYRIGWPVDPYVSNTVRTAVSSGYDYKVTPVVKTADFFDPGYVTQSIGFTYDRLKGFTTRLGVGFQEIFTNRYRQYSDDPTTLNKTEAFRFETGLESVTDGSVTLDDNLLFASKLRLFTRFNHLDVWDIRWDNTLTAQVNKYVNVQLNVLTVYEKSQSLKTQVKEALLLGLTYSIY